MKSKKEISHPKSRTLQFEKESFLCDNGGHDCGHIFLYRGRWLCGPCLKDAVRRDGGSQHEIYGAIFYKAERRMIAGHMRRVTPEIPRPVMIKPLRRKKTKAKPDNGPTSLVLKYAKDSEGKPDPDCDWCGGQGCAECMYT